MTDRLVLPWPDPVPFRKRDGRAIRILAVSDEGDPALDAEATRDGIGPLDMIVGCGDLDPPYLAFLADAFGVLGQKWPFFDVPDALGEHVGVAPVCAELP